MDSETLKNKGNQYFVKGDFVNAINFYTQAINADPNNHVVYSNRSSAYLQTHQHNNALSDAQKCYSLSLSLSSSFPKAFLRLADAQVSLGLLDEALKNYSECMKTSDESVTKLGEAGIQNVKVKEFYSNLLPKDSAVEPKYVSQKKGKGLFAAKDFKVGDIILEEDAYLYSLDPECKKSAVCEHCMRFVEPLNSQIQRSGLKLSQSDQNNVQKCDVPKPFACPGCNTIFCSENCYTKAKDLYHSKLCVPASQHDHPIIQYENLPMVKEGPTSTTFKLVMKILAIMAIQLEKDLEKETYSEQNYPKWEASSLLGNLKCVQRGSLMKMQPVYDGSNLALLQSHLAQPLNLLKDGLFKCPAQFEQAMHKVVNEQLFDELLGMVSMNNTTAYVLPPFIFHTNKPEREVAKMRAHGMCIFLVHSCINHSCSPNVENRIRKEDKVTNAKVIIRAIKPIKRGEELHFTYIDETQKKADRKQELLSKYGFTCNCPSCS